jgi:hypothetical protein
MTANPSPVTSASERPPKLPLSGPGTVPVATTVVLFAVVCALILFVVLV